MMTGRSWQRRQWFNTSHYWRSYYDIDRGIVFEYSTQDRLRIDPDDWTENVNARIDDTGVSADFSCRGDRTNVYVVYELNGDILVRQDAGYPGTSWGWCDPVISFQSTSDFTHSFCDIAYDGDYHALNVVCNQQDLLTGKWGIYIRHGHEGGIPDVNEELQTVVVDLDYRSPCTIRRGSDTIYASMIAVWKENYVTTATYKSRYREGHSWEATQTIDNGKRGAGAGAGYGFHVEHTTLGGASIIVYINDEQQVCSMGRPPGSGRPWFNSVGVPGIPDILHTHKHCTAPAAGEVGVNTIHYYWLDINSDLRTRRLAYEDVGPSDYYPPLIARPDNSATTIAGIYVKAADAVSDGVIIWQSYGEVKCLFREFVSPPDAVCELECEGESTPIYVSDPQPDFTGVFPRCNSSSSSSSTSGESYPHYAVACQIDISTVDSFIDVYSVHNLDQSEGIIFPANNGTVTCYTFGEVDPLGTLTNNWFVGTFHSDPHTYPIFLRFSGVTCEAGTQLKLKDIDGNLLIVYLPAITESIDLFVSDDGSTWEDAVYDHLAYANPETTWLSGRVPFTAPVYQGQRCESVECQNVLPIDGSTYFWRMRMVDNYGEWTPWSDGTNRFLMHTPSSASSIGPRRTGGPTEPTTYVFPGGYTLTLDYPEHPVIYRYAPNYIYVTNSQKDPNWVKRTFTHDEIIEMLDETYLFLKDEYYESLVLQMIRIMVLEVKFEPAANRRISKYNDRARHAFQMARGAPALEDLRRLVIDDAYGQSSKSSWSSSSSSGSSTSSSSSSSSSSLSSWSSGSSSQSSSKSSSSSSSYSSEVS